MSRLTTKIEDLDFYKMSSAYIDEIPNQFLDKDYVGTAINKLGKLEDLEEQLGCPLEVLSKVIENGFYDNYCYIPPSRILRIDIFNKEILKMYYDEATSRFSVKLTDYKKTWWLKEDKSE